MTPQKPLYHLHIGELLVCPQEAVISTVLGSCVSVCLFSKKHAIGGMIHYAHPKPLSSFGQKEDFRYGTLAIPALIQELCAAVGGRPQDLAAKIAGGASETDGVRKNFDVGLENIRIAQDLLAKHQIPLLGKSVGGASGRKVLFHVPSGRLQVALLSGTAATAEAPKAASPQAPVPRTSSRPRKVLIVDDSRTIRELLQRILKEDPELHIIGMASDAREADAMVRAHRPDVITLDIHMPHMTGVEWLERLLPEHPIPVVMISSLQLQEGNEVFRALELGAVDYIQKPTLAELPTVGPLIREKVKEAASAKVLRRPSSPQKSRRGFAGELDLRKVLAIGASTGGTEALKEVLQALPEKIPPTVIVQHIPPVFSKAFAERLNSLCPFEVKEAEDGDELKPSRVLIAPGGRQMKVQKSPQGLCVRITDDAPMSRHKPSVDYLFHSIADLVGKNSVGVILTGMGSDGAQGLLAMKKQGARTIAQDEDSCVVYGMPRVAYELGAAESVCPLPQIAEQILTTLNVRRIA